MGMGGKGDRAGQDVDGLPHGACARATDADALGAHDDGARVRAVLVLLHDARHAARDGAGHPVRGQPGAGQFGHADRHALAAEAVGDPGDGGGDHLGILVGVGADLVLAAVDLAAQSGALEEDIFEAEAEAFLGDVRGQRQFQLRPFDPERPFQRRLHA